MNPVSLYVHLPFCSRKCLFCSFAVSIGQLHRREDYLQSLLKEMHLHPGRSLQTIYLGGGTPSLMEAGQLERLMAAIRQFFSTDAVTEMTLEANPEHVTVQQARQWRALGFSRISLGVQSVNARYLKFLGRSHDAATAGQAYQALRQAGFQNINVDLMYAFPGQTMEELTEDIEALAAWGSEHMSLYTLTVEPNSRFYVQQMKLDDDEKLADHYIWTADLLKQHGLQQYEVSNFSKPGFESRHNINYWLGGEYIGLGMGAHGFLDGRRSWNTSSLQDYLQRTAGGQTVVEGYEDLSEELRAVERMILGLRMNQGIAWAIVPEGKQVAVRHLIEGGFLQLEKGMVTTTPHGRLVLDELASRLV